LALSPTTYMALVSLEIYIIHKLAKVGQKGEEATSPIWEFSKNPAKVASQFSHTLLCDSTQLFLDFRPAGGMLCSLYCCSSLLSSRLSEPSPSFFLSLNSSPKPSSCLRHLLLFSSCNFPVVHPQSFSQPLCTESPLFGPTTLLTSTSSHLKLLTYDSKYPSLTLFGWKDFD
jgi:hypothetical protein